MSYTITRGAIKPTPVAPAPGLDHDGKQFILKPPYYPSTAVKELAQAKWDANRRVWLLPDLMIYAHTVLEMYPGLPITARSVQRLERSLPLLNNWDGVSELRKVWKQLYVFQQESVSRLVLDTRKCQQVVLSPGLGKTIVSLLAARILLAKNVLVVAIKDLMPQWQQEEAKWFGKTTLQRLHQQAPEGPGWFVANYDTVVGRLHQVFCDHPWDVVIVDESVLVANRKTRRFKNLLDLRHKVSRFWELSGSPVKKLPDDLWAQLHLLYPEDFRSYWRFAKRYCYTDETIWGIQLTQPRADRNASEDLKDVQFVRNQKDVLKDLPEAIPQLVPIQLEGAQLKAYQEMANGFVTQLEGGKRIEAPIVLSQLIRLQQVTSNLINLTGTSDEPAKGTKYVDPHDVSAKADALVQMLDARQFALPAIVWTNWVPGAEALLKRLRRVAPELRIEWIHGAEGKKGEEHNEKTFLDYKEGRVDVLILAMPVGKFGHNLQNTHTVIYYDKTWMGDDFVQSMHRVIRIGLDHRPVVITLKAIDTTDEMIELNIAGKLVPISQISNADLASMLKALTGKESQ